MKHIDVHAPFLLFEVLQPPLEFITLTEAAKPSRARGLGKIEALRKLIGVDGTLALADKVGDQILAGHGSFRIEFEEPCRDGIQAGGGNAIAGKRSGAERPSSFVELTSIRIEDDRGLAGEIPRAPGGGRDVGQALHGSRISLPFEIREKPEAIANDAPVKDKTELISPKRVLISLLQPFFGV